MRYPTTLAPSAARCQGLVWMIRDGCWQYRWHRYKEVLRHRYFRKSQKRIETSRLIRIELARGRYNRKCSRTITMSPGRRPSGKVRSQGHSNPAAIQAMPMQTSILFMLQAPFLVPRRYPGSPTPRKKPRHKLATARVSTVLLKSNNQTK